MNVSIYRCSLVVDETGVGLIITFMAIYDGFELCLFGELRLHEATST